MKTGDEMYIIQSGKVAIRKDIGSAKKTLTVLEKGDFFGEMSILERLPRTADAEVMENADLITINSQTFGEMIRSNPEIAVRMLRKYSMRMRELSEQMEKYMAAGEQSAGGEFSLPSSDGPSQPDVPMTIPAGGETRAYFIGKSTGKIYPVYKDEVLLGRYDSVTGHRPEIDSDGGRRKPEREPSSRSIGFQGRPIPCGRGDRDDERHLHQRQENPHRSLDAH